GHLAETLIRGRSSLSSGERELIASYVSYLNACEFCSDSHGAAAANYLSDPSIVQKVRGDLDAADLAPKLRALLDLAAQVQQGGRKVQPVHIEAARTQGASDEDIHDTVLLAAAFCMFNRYVDGLGTPPAQPEAYAEMGQMLSRRGYKQPPRALRWVVRRLLNRKFPGL